MSNGLCQERGSVKEVEQGRKRWKGQWKRKVERKKKREKSSWSRCSGVSPLVVSLRAGAAFLPARDVQRTNSFVSTIKPSALCWPCPVWTGVPFKHCWSCRMWGRESDVGKGGQRTNSEGSNRPASSPPVSHTHTHTHTHRATLQDWLLFSVPASTMSFFPSTDLTHHPTRLILL